MDYVDAATTNVLSPDIFPVEDLRNMLKHIESELLSMMHPSISLDNTLHFYHYLSTHVLIGDRHFLLLIAVLIQNKAQQLQIYEIFSLPIPHSNLSAQYKLIISIQEQHMMRQMQLPWQICSTDLVSIPTGSLQERCTIPTPHKPATICYSLYAKMTS